MSDISSSDAEKPMEQPEHDLSKAMGQLTVTPDNSNKSPPSLSDMPVDVVREIIDRCEYIEHLKLRKVSKSLRELIDNQRPVLKNLRITTDTGSFMFYYNGCGIVYAHPDTYLDEPFDKSMLSEEYERFAVDDLAFILKNPKLQLENFSCYFGGPFTYHRNYQTIRNTFHSIGSQISAQVTDLWIHEPRSYCSLLQYLKPGVLEKIDIRLYAPSDAWDDTTPLDTMRDNISQSEQWRQAEELEMHYLFDRFPMEYATHFKRFLFNEEKMELRLVTRIRDYLSNVENFEYCQIKTDKCLSPDDQQIFSGRMGRPVAPNQRTKYVSHFSIPDSDDYLEFLFFEKSIEIRKMKKY